MLFYKSIKKKHKFHKTALREYLKKIVIYQSTNKKCANFNPMRKATLNLTQRQIQEHTGLSLGLINRVLKEMREERILKVAKTKASGHYKEMIFFYFVDIYQAICKRLAYKYSKITSKIKNKVNTKNNIYNILKKSYKKYYYELLNNSPTDPMIHYDPIKSNFITKSEDLFYLERLKNGKEEKITIDNILDLLGDKDPIQSPIQKRHFYCPF